MKKHKTLILWIIAIFFALGAMAFFPSITSLFAIGITILVIPIPKWQAILSSKVKGKIKKAIAFALVPLTFLTAPTTENTPVQSIETPFTVSTEGTSIPWTEATIFTTESYIEETTVPPHIHTFALATCTDPQTCPCGATEGTANGHTWMDATCTIPQTCMICNETTGSKANHLFVKGKCSVCGQLDPDYEHETMVWIPTNGGSKYHSHSSCSKMKNPKQVTQSVAEAKGFTPCKKCF